jgi:hypothetical protein
MGFAWSVGSGTEMTASVIAGKLTELFNSSDQRTSQSEKGRKLVDGRGAERVVQAMRDIERDTPLNWDWVITS